VTDAPPAEVAPGPTRQMLEEGLETHLRAVAQMMARSYPARTRELAYTSYEGATLALGRFWTPQARPRRYGKGTERACFHNTLMLTVYHPRLRYVEGYALPTIRGDVGIPVQHAWAVDAQDRVIDVTWPEPEHSAYYGFVIEREDIAALVELDDTNWGVLGGDYRLDFPILRYGRVLPPVEEPG
jgi:hypothetical protein